MDLGLSATRSDSFRFQTRVLERYDELVDEYDLRVIDASGSITEQQHLVRNSCRATGWQRRLSQRTTLPRCSAASLQGPHPRDYLPR